MCAMRLLSFTLRLVTANRINDRGVKNTQPATQMELVVVSAMKGYLRRMPEKEALKKVEGMCDI